MYGGKSFFSRSPWKRNAPTLGRTSIFKFLGVGMGAGCIDKVIRFSPSFRDLIAESGIFKILPDPGWSLSRTAIRGRGDVVGTLSIVRPPI